MKKGIYLLGLGVLLLLCMDLQAKVRLPHFFSSIWYCKGICLSGCGEKRIRMK